MPDWIYITVWLSTVAMVFGYIRGMQSAEKMVKAQYTDGNTLVVLVDILRRKKLLNEVVHDSVNLLVDVHRAGQVSRDTYDPVLRKLRSLL